MTAVHDTSAARQLASKKRQQ